MAKIFGKKCACGAANIYFNADIGICSGCYYSHVIFFRVRKDSRTTFRETYIFLLDLNGKEHWGIIYS